MTVVVAIKKWLKQNLTQDAEVQEMIRAGGNRGPITVAGSASGATGSGLPEIRFDYMGGNLQTNRCGEVYAGEIRMQIKVIGQGGAVALDDIATRIETLMGQNTSAAHEGWVWDVRQDTPVQMTETKNNAQWSHLGGVWVFEVRRGIL